MRRREFAPRAVIVREGSTDDSAFLVLSGRVAVRRNDPDSGIEFLLAELGEGEMFGEMALLTRKPRTASVVALEATTCGIIEQSDFDQLLREHPAAVRAMMAALADRLDAVNRHVGHRLRESVAVENRPPRPPAAAAGRHERRTRSFPSRLPTTG